MSKKNLALIKIDVEGSEEKAIKSGIELISKYHIPFIFLEFSPEPLRNHGSEPKEFLKLFELNGYKFSQNNFFDTDYLTIDKIISMKIGVINLYIIHSEIIKNNTKINNILFP